MARDDWIIGALAAQDAYNPEEGAFQRGIRDTPWFSEFEARHGAPNLEDPNYDYRAAWKAGARPTVRDPGDNELHWPSAYKGENHPNRYVGGVDTISGAMADPYDVPLEQSTGVGWANRVAEALYARPGYDSTVVARTASPLVTITEGDIGRATEAAMGVSGGGMSTKAQKGIKAYHSSPHDFDKFDLSKIGTGEGAQVYGHGLYFAENPVVSGQGGQYWGQFLDRFKGDELAAAYALKQSKFDREAAIAAARGDLDYMQKRYDALPSGIRDNPKARGLPTREALAGRERELALLESGQPLGPRTYEVNINADPAHFLDWDKPITKQPDIQGLLEHHPQASRLLGNDMVRGRLSSPTGEAIVGRIGRDAEGAASLREAGVPGIKYLDQGSRGANAANVFQVQKGARFPFNETDIGKWAVPGINETFRTKEAALAALPKPTSNYVVFDPNIIDIMKKYGLVGVPAGFGALAAQDQYQPEGRF